MGSLRTQSTQELQDDAGNTLEKTGIACDRLRQELKRCIKESACVQRDRRPAAECIKSSDGSVPDRCFILLSSFSDCKRSMVYSLSFSGHVNDL